MSNLKHHKTVLIPAVLLAAACAHATVIVSENFDSGYDLVSGTGVTTASLAGQNPTNSPFSGAWTESGTIDTTVIRAVSWESAGRAIMEDTSNGGTDFFSTRPFNGGIAAATTYFGFDLTTGSSVASGAHFALTTGAKGYFGAGIDLSGNFGFNWNGGIWTSSSTVAQASTTYRVVLKMTEGGNGDQWSIFINPTSGEEGDQTAIASGAGSYYVGGNASFPLNSLRIGKDENTGSPSGTTYFDNIIVGTEFADVVVVPEPATTAILLGLGTLGLVLWRRRQLR